METKPRDRAGVIAPPPVIYLIALAIGLLVHWLYPVQVLPIPFAIGIGLLLIATAGPIVISALCCVDAAFRRHCFVG